MKQLGKYGPLHFMLAYEQALLSNGASEASRMQPEQVAGVRGGDEGDGACRISFDAADLPTTKLPCYFYVKKLINLSTSGRVFLWLNASECKSLMIGPKIH